MRYFIYSFLIFTFLILNTSSTVTAQDSLAVEANNTAELSSQKAYSSKEAIHQLHKNSLVVLLRTNTKRLEKLGILSRDKNISAQQKAVLLEKIGRTKDETKLINTALINSFNRKYSFSKVYFVYDTELQNLINGTTKGIFVDNNGEVDASIELPNQTFYICNYTLVSSSNATEGLVIYDSSMKKMKRPFPAVAVAPSSGFHSLLRLFTSNEKYQGKMVEKDVEKLQLRFETFLRKS